jgi:hypothetical protein
MAYMGVWTNYTPVSAGLFWFFVRFEWCQNVPEGGF